MAAKRTLLTGGTGFVGANLARRLLEAGAELHLAVRPEHTTWRIAGISADLRLHEAALEDSEALGRVVREVRPERVFHLATHGAYSWQTEARRILSTNVIGTANLIEACVDAEILVNTGSSSEYGFCDHAPREDEPLAPNSHYAVAKASATMLCQHAARERGVPMPTLRLYSVFGPYEDPRRLMPTLILRGLAGELPPLVAPEIAHDFVYVDDACDAFIAAANASYDDPAAVFNIGSGVQTRLDEVVRVAKEVFGIESAPLWGSMEKRVWDTRTWVADARRAEQQLGWRATRSFEQGFRSMVAWFQADRSRQQA